MQTSSRTSVTSTKFQYLFSPCYMMGVNRDKNSQIALNAKIHRHIESRESYNLVDIGDILSGVRTCRVTPALKVSLLLSFIRVPRAYDESASDFPRHESEKAS